MTKRAVILRSTWLGGPLALVLAAGCAMDSGEDMSLDDEPGLDPTTDQGTPDESGSEDPGSEQTSDVEQGLTTLMSVNFENYNVGTLSSPWYLGASLTSRATIESTSDHGKVLTVQGSQTLGDFLLARLDISVPSQVVFSADVKPDSGASFVWSIHGQGISTYKRRIRLIRWPGSTRLVSNASPLGDRDCGAFPSNAWTRVSLVIHPGSTSSTYDVLINGNATACRGLPAALTAPFNMIQVMDSSSDGWGGRVRFDNIVLARP
jgi:hypothetical protein